MIMFGSSLPSALGWLVATKVYSGTGADIVMESITLTTRVGAAVRSAVRHSRHVGFCEPKPRCRRPASFGRQDAPPVHRRLTAPRPQFQPRAPLPCQPEYVAQPLASRVTAKWQSAPAPAGQGTGEKQ